MDKIPYMSPPEGVPELWVMVNRNRLAEFEDEHARLIAEGARLRRAAEQVIRCSIEDNGCWFVSTESLRELEQLLRASDKQRCPFCGKMVSREGLHSCKSYPAVDEQDVYEFEAHICMEPLSVGETKQHCADRLLEKLLDFGVACSLHEPTAEGRQYVKERGEGDG